MDESNKIASDDGKEKGNFSYVEFLDFESIESDSEVQPGFEDADASDNGTPNPLLVKSPEIPVDDAVHFKQSEEADIKHQENYSVEFNVSLNLSTKEFKQFTFHFVGVFYARLFKTQRLAEPVFVKDIFGNTIDELLECLWENSYSYVSREVLVDEVQEEKVVNWSSKEEPDFSDVSKFIVLRNEKTKKLYSTQDLRDSLKILTSWRGKNIQVHIYKYSTSVTSNTIWELVNKKLLQPCTKDRAGAPTTEEVFNCIGKLKEVHCHYTALYSSWEKWANFILSQPGDRHTKLIYEAPPDEYLHLFRAPPISEGSHLQLTRQGIQIAHSISDSVSSAVNKLCETVDVLSVQMANVQMQAHELKARLKAQVINSSSLLKEIQASMLPEESEFSKRLASAITDMMDVDHQE